MPRGKHLPKASSKENRMYQHIVETEIKQQKRSPRRAKQIAAATVRKFQGKKRGSA